MSKVIMMPKRGTAEQQTRAWYEALKRRLEQQRQEAAND